MTYADARFCIIYLADVRWKLHRAFVLDEHGAALGELADLRLRFPSYVFEMVYTDGRVLMTEVAPLPDDAVELVE